MQMGIIELIYYFRQESRLIEVKIVRDMVKLELLSNATTIDSAFSYIGSKQQQGEQHQKKHLTLGSADDDDDNVDDSQLSKEDKQTIF